MFTHIGWVPCINGHLDFGLMVPGIQGSFTNNELHDPKTSNINYGFLNQQNHHARRIVLQSKVDWRDTIDENHDGKFRVIVVAEAKPSEDLDNRILAGRIFIYPLISEPKINDEGKITLPWFDYIHAMTKLACQYKSDGTEENWKETQKSLNNNYTDLLSCLEKNNKKHIHSNFYQILFEISPRGLTKLAFISDESSEYTENQKYLTLRQAFYYIKYSLHSHKHHYAKEDSLTTIVPIEDRELGPTKIESLKMLGQLKRELTNIKRTYSNGGQKVYGEEQGIIAYMNSFCASLKHEKYLDDEIYYREKDYLSSLSKSFSVQVDKREKRDKCVDDIKAVYRVYVAWFISIISVIWITSVKEFFSYPDEIKMKVNASLLDHMLIFSTIMICAYFIYQSQVKRKIHNTIDEKGFLSWVEKHYSITDNDFKNQKRARILKSLSALLITIVSIVILECLLRYF